MLLRSLLLGSWANGMCYVLACVELLRYIRESKNDTLVVRSAVGLSFAVATVSTLALFAGVYLVSLILKLIHDLCPSNGMCRKQSPTVRDGRRRTSDRWLTSPLRRRSGLPSNTEFHHPRLLLLYGNCFTRGAVFPDS